MVIWEWVRGIVILCLGVPCNGWKVCGYLAGNLNRILFYMHSSEFNGCDEQRIFSLKVTHLVIGRILCVLNASISTSIVELSVLSEDSSCISVD